MTALRSQTSAPAAPSFQSWSISDVGSVRRLNRDSLVERNDAGLWAVADGMGSDNTPGIGSAAIARALARIEPFDSQYAGRRAVRSALSDVNLQLFQRAAEERLGNVGASAVVLLIQDGQYACMWAGTCRAYVRREGQLRQISSDHVLEEPGVDRLSAGYMPILTRSIGSAAKLEVDAVSGEVQAGDRFLLCSDGVRVFEDGDLGQFTAAHDPHKALRDLVARALELGAIDNISAIIVEG